MIQFSLPCEMSALETMNSQLDDFLGSFDSDEQLSYHVRLILEELFVNFITHGGNPDGEFHVSISLQNQQLSIEIRDDGIPFNPLSKDDVKIDIGLEDRKEGGLGLHFVKSLSAIAAYERVDDHNVVKLVLGNPRA